MPSADWRHASCAPGRLPSLGDRMLRSALRHASPRGQGARLSIAMFHRVVARPDSLFPDEVDGARFDAICGWLRLWFNVLPLDEAVQRRQAGDLPDRALCITFDDGYADNHDIALPILQRHGLPATVYVATQFIDGGRMWNDSIVESIRRHSGESLDLRGLQLPGIGSVDLDSVAARRGAIAQLLPAIKYLPAEERLCVAGQLATLAKVQLPDDLMMRSDQLRALASAGVQIGAHTQSHPILARLDDAQAFNEIETSKRQLEALLQQPVHAFAYPNGRPGADYLPRDAALVRKAGFRSAVTTAPGAAARHTDVFELPRFTPWDRGRWKFGARMLKNLIA